MTLKSILSSMPTKIHLFLLSFFIFSFVMSSSINSVFATEFEYDLFVSFAGKSIFEKNIMSRGFKRLPIIYGRYIDPYHDKRLNIIEYKKYINKTLLEYSGPVAIDWEGKAYQTLTEVDNKQNDRQQVIGEYVKAVNILQEQTTNQLQIGFYALPSKKSTRSHLTIQAMQKLNDIYSNVSIIFPSLYLNDSYIFRQQSIEFIRKHLRNALKISCKGRKRQKVYAFITHRWHPNSRFSGNQLIPLKLFTSYIKAIRDTKYEECAVDGIVWWGADELWYDKRRRIKIVASIDEYNSMEEYGKLVLNKYADIILQIFSNN